jgi:hypothetical protein
VLRATTIQEWRRRDIALNLARPAEAARGALGHLSQTRTCHLGKEARGSCSLRLYDATALCYLYR